MFVTRVTAVVFLLLTACTGWDSSTPSHAQPPALGSVPSHHAPPAPDAVGPAADEPATVEPEAPQPPASPPGDRVAIASVMLLDDCPDRSPATDEPSRASAMPDAARRRAPTSQPPRATCHQSTVQLAVHGDQPGQLRIVAVRVLDPASLRPVGSSTLRQPSHWQAADQNYAPWDERVLAGTEHRASYKLGALEFPQANPPGSLPINTYSGPFILEVDVAIDGRRQTVRSPQFSRDEPDRVVT